MESEKNEKSIPKDGGYRNHKKGRNEKRIGRDDRQIIAWEKEVADIDKQLDEIRAKPYPNCAKDKQEFERQRRGWKKKIAKRGEEHSRIAKK